MSDPPQQAGVVLYDGDCGFCKIVLAALLRWDRARRLGVAPIQSTLGEELLPDMTSQERLGSWHLIDGAGGVRSGGDAAPTVLAELPGGMPFARLAARFPGLRSRAYEWVAGHRVLLGRPFGTRSRAWAGRVITERGTGFAAPADSSSARQHSPAEGGGSV